MQVSESVEDQSSVATSTCNKEKKVTNVVKKTNRLETQEIAFRYLQNLSSPEEIFNNSLALKYFHHTKENVLLRGQRNHLKYINMSFNYNYLEIALNLLEYLNKFLIGKCLIKTRLRKELTFFFVKIPK